MECGVDERSCPGCQQTQVWKASEVGGVFEQFYGPERLSEQCLTLDVEGSESTGSVTGIVGRLQGQHEQVVKTTLSGSRPGFEFAVCPAICWLCDLTPVT